MVQNGSDGPKTVPNAQKLLGWPFRTLLDHFGTLTSLTLLAIFVCFIGAFFWTPCKFKILRIKRQLHLSHTILFGHCRYPQPTREGPLCSCSTQIKIRRRSKPVVSMWESSTTQRVNNISVFCHQHWLAPDHILTLKLEVKTVEQGYNCNITLSGYHAQQHLKKYYQAYLLTSF